MYYSHVARYIKKEDAAHYRLQQYRLIGILLIAITVMQIVLCAYLAPELSETYTIAQTQPHWLLQLLPYGMVTLSALSFLIAGSFLTKKVDRKQLAQQLSSYEPKEMMEAKQVLDMNSAYFALFFGLLYIGYCMISLVIPLLTLPD